jgi:hypothetical protein
VAQRLKGAVSSKIYGYEDVLCPLIAQACIEVGGPLPRSLQGAKAPDPRRRRHH